jgi:hypothetical protein
MSIAKRHRKIEIAPVLPDVGVLENAVKRQDARLRGVEMYFEMFYLPARADMEDFEPGRDN